MTTNANNIGFLDDCRKNFNSIYQPIHLQSSDEKMQVKSTIKFIKGASNYALYCLQRGIPGDFQLCTFDPLVWLPPELLDVILKQVSIEDLLACACVNKTWNRYMLSHRVWRTACGPTFVDPTCTRLCKRDTDWMVASRDAVAVYRTLLTAGALVIKRVMVRDLLGHREAMEQHWILPPSHVIAKDGVLCAVYDHAGSWLIHDTTFGRTWALSRGSPVTCFRFIDASKSSKKVLQRVGMVLYGTEDGTLHWPIEHLPFPRLDYRRHAGSVISCDADMETEIMASIGRDGYLRIFGVWSMAMLCAVPVETWADTVHVLKPHDGHFAVIVTNSYGTFMKYSWPVTPGDPHQCKIKIETLNPHLTHFYENIYDTFHRYGDFLNLKIDMLVVKCLEDEEVIHSVVQSDIGTIGAVVRQSNEKANTIVVLDALTLRTVHHRTVPTKVRRLVGAGRKFALVQVIGNVFANECLALLDLTLEECIINSIVLPKTRSPLVLTDHGCPSGLALDFLPVTEMRLARLEASDGILSSRYKWRRCLIEGQSTRHLTDCDAVIRSSSYSTGLLSVGEKGGGGSLLDIDPKEMEDLSQLEDKAKSMDDLDLENCSGDIILYTGYDYSNGALFYVTWDLLAGRNKVKCKLKGE